MTQLIDGRPKPEQIFEKHFTEFPIGFTEDEIDAFRKLVITRFRQSRSAPMPHQPLALGAQALVAVEQVYQRVLLRAVEELHREYPELSSRLGIGTFAGALPPDAP